MIEGYTIISGLLVAGILGGFYLLVSYMKWREQRQWEDAMFHKRRGR